MNQTQAKFLNENPVWKAFLNGEPIEYHNQSFDVWLETNVFDVNLLVQRPELFRLKKEEFPALKGDQKWHNPANLTPEQVGVKEGWRPLFTSELNHPPEDAQYHSQGKYWINSLEPEEIRSKSLTYRTKAPLPSVCPFKVGDKIKSKAWGTVFTIKEFREKKAFYEEKYPLNWDWEDALERYYRLYTPEYIALEEKDFPAGTLVKFSLGEHSEEYQAFTTPQGILMVHAGTLCCAFSYKEAKEKLLMKRPGEDWVKCQKEKK